MRQRAAPGVEWFHSVQDAAAMVRDFTKWDDLPISLEHFAESAVRAYQIAMTPPTMPVVLVADGDLQEDPISADTKIRIPKLTTDVPPVGDSGSVARSGAASGCGGESGACGRPHGAHAGGPGLPGRSWPRRCNVRSSIAGRMNFPTRHPLNQSDRARAAVADADVILGLERRRFLRHHAIPSRPDRTHVAVRHQAEREAHHHQRGRSLHQGNYQDFQRYNEVDLAIAADSEATLPSLTEAVKRLSRMTASAPFRIAARELEAAHMQALERSRTRRPLRWDASPISTARMCMELWGQIQNEDWSLVGATTFVSKWPQRLWNFDKHYQYIGGAGGYGIGYDAPAATGAALANRKYGRLTVNIQCDGDLMYAPGVLWTAAHHKIPVLHIMHNNRAYHQEVMQVQIMADRHSRGIIERGIGTTITPPDCLRQARREHGHVRRRAD